MDREEKIEIRPNILSELQAKMILENCHQERRDILNEQINILTHLTRVEERKNEGEISHPNEIIINFESSSKNEETPKEDNLIHEAEPKSLDKNENGSKKLLNNKLKRNTDQERRNDFYRIFNEGFRFSYRKGKYRPDCLRKKIKTNHFNFINYLISKCLNKEFNPIYEKNIRDEIRIKQNRDIYKQTMREFLDLNCYIFRHLDIDYKIDLFEHEIFSQILGLSLFEFFEKYYYREDCTFHNEHLEKLKKQHSESDITYYHLYLIHDLDYLNYFLYEGGNQKTRKDINLKKPRQPKVKFS